MNFLVEQDDQLNTVAIRIHGDNLKCKLLHFIRHAEGEHNVVGNMDRRNYLLPEFEDAVLSSKGLKQCIALSNSLRERKYLNGIQLVVTSPLRRALQTATRTFQNLIGRIPWVALECVREVMGLHPCDRRRPRSETSEKFPHVNFEYITTEDDNLYSVFGSQRESSEKVKERCFEFLRWISSREETQIVVVTHSAFLNIFSKAILGINSAVHFANAETRSYIIRIGAGVSSVTRPVSSRVDDRATIKILHFVRHAQAEHNVLATLDKSALLLPELEDAGLTEEGVAQCLALSERCKSKYCLGNVQLVVVSPLRRTLQTATIGLAEMLQTVPCLALEDVREVTGVRPCDRRKRISETAPLFPEIDFGCIGTDEDDLFARYQTMREPAEEVVRRCRSFLQWVSEREEREILVVTHSAFLRALFGHVIKSVTDVFLQYDNTELRSYTVAIAPAKDLAKQQNSVVPANAVKSIENVTAQA